MSVRNRAVLYQGSVRISVQYSSYLNTHQIPFVQNIQLADCFEMMYDRSIFMWFELKMCFVVLSYDTNDRIVLYISYAQMPVFICVEPLVAKSNLNTTVNNHKRIKVEWFFRTD